MGEDENYLEQLEADKAKAVIDRSLENVLGIL